MPKLYRDLMERLLANSMAVDCGHVDQDGQPSECWLWLGSIDRDGYGRMNLRIDGKHRQCRAHRVSFMEFTGQLLEEEDTLDHLCRQKNCIHPNHTEPVPRDENSARMQQFWANQRLVRELEKAAA
jgi:hypothetical protein